MAYEYQNFASLGVNLNRQAYGALDISAVFKTEADLTWYMTYGKESSKPTGWEKVEAPYPYEGQIVSLVPDTGVVAVYVLEAEKNERGEIQSYDDGKVKLVKKTLSIADSAVSSVNGLTGAISIIPEPDSIIKVEKDSNNIKIGADTSGLVKINANNIVDGNFKLSSGSVSVGFSGEGINIISNSHSILGVGPTGIISNTNNINIAASGTGEISINGNRGVSIDVGTGEISINGERGVSIGSPSGEVLINSNVGVIINCNENSFKFKRNVYDSPSEDNTYYVATEKYVDDKIGNISSNKITSPDGNSFVEVTNENGLKIKNKTFDLTVPQKSGTIALIGDLPKQASTTEPGIIKISETLSNATDSVPTTSTVNTAVTNLTTAINNLKSEVAGGVIYKGGVTASISENNITLAGANIPIRTGYMYSITSGSIVVDEVTYTVGDYIIYKGATESQSEVVSKDNLTFINAQDSDVAKLGAQNEFTATNNYFDGIVANYIRLPTFDGSINLTKSGTIAINGDSFEVNNSVETKIDSGIVTIDASSIIFTTKPKINVNAVATEDQLPKLPEGTKQLPTDGTWTMTQVVTLLNQIAAALGAPVYSA